MKVIAIETGRAGIIIPAEEVFPLTGIYLPELSGSITERYTFVSSPNFSLPLAELRDQGLEFRVGKRRTNDKEHSIQSFIIVDGGFVASAYSTEVARAFLEDFFSWASKSHGFRTTSSTFSRYFFLSQIIVEFEESIDKVIRGFEMLAASMGNLFEATYGADHTFVLSALAFDYDRTEVADSNLNQLAAFRLERRVDTPYSLNRFFCTAPLRTEDHIRFLEELESKLKN